MAFPPPIPVSKLQIVKSVEPTDLQYLVRPSLGDQGSLAIETQDLIDSLPSPPITLPLVYPPGTTQTFSPNATNSGLNVGQVASDPTNEVNGNIWYNTATNQLMATVNGVPVAIAAPSPIEVLQLRKDWVYNVDDQLDPLHSFVVPAGLLSDTKVLRLTYGGTFADGPLGSFPNPLNVRLQLQAILPTRQRLIIDTGIVEIDPDFVYPYLAWQINGIFGSNALEMDYSVNIIVGPQQINFALANIPLKSFAGADQPSGSYIGNFGSYMTPFNAQTDAMTLTVMGQCVDPTGTVNPVAQGIAQYLSFIELLTAPSATIIASGTHTADH